MHFTYATFESLRSFHGSITRSSSLQQVQKPFFGGMTKIHVAPTNTPLNMGFVLLKTLRRENLMSMILLMLHVRRDDRNQLFGVHLSTSRPIHPNTTNPNLTLDPLMFMSMVTPTFQTLHLLKVEHPPSVFLIGFVGQGIFQSMHALIHVNSEHPWHVHDLFNT